VERVVRRRLRAAGPAVGAVGEPCSAKLALVEPCSRSLCPPSQPLRRMPRATDKERSDRSVQGSGRRVTTPEETVGKPRAAKRRHSLVVAHPPSRGARSGSTSLIRQQQSADTPHVVGWVQAGLSGLQTEPKCWRCLEETVPDEDELGLCKWCIADLQDSPRSSRSPSSPRTMARA
jgi:hypothetical protein